jgi:hypothetical protein
MVCPSSSNETRKLAMFVGTPSLVQLNRKEFLLGKSKAFPISHEERKRGEEVDADCSNVAWSPLTLCQCLLQYENHAAKDEVYHIYFSMH